MTFALIITIVGFLLLLEKIGLISDEVWSLFWPLVIIFVGLSMMFNRMNDRHMFDACGCWKPEHNHGSQTKTKKRKTSKK